MVHEATAWRAERSELIDWKGVGACKGVRMVILIEPPAALTIKEWQIMCT